MSGNAGDDRSPSRKVPFTPHLTEGDLTDRDAEWESDSYDAAPGGELRLHPSGVAGESHGSQPPAGAVGESRVRDRRGRGNRGEGRQVVGPPQHLHDLEDDEPTTRPQPSRCQEARGGRDGGRRYPGPPEHLHDLDDDEPTTRPQSSQGQETRGPRRLNISANRRGLNRRRSITPPPPAPNANLRTPTAQEREDHRLRAVRLQDSLDTQWHDQKSSKAKKAEIKRCEKIAAGAPLDPSEPPFGGAKTMAPAPSDPRNEPMDESGYRLGEKEEQKKRFKGRKPKIDEKGYIIGDRTPSDTPSDEKPKTKKKGLPRGKHAKKNQAPPPSDDGSEGDGKGGSKKRRKAGKSKREDLDDDDLEDKRSKRPSKIVKHQGPSKAQARGDDDDVPEDAPKGSYKKASKKSQPRKHDTASDNDDDVADPKGSRKDDSDDDADLYQ